ncbi:hypothetical protein FQZ97_759070 [compost metagenome]
MLSNRCIGFGNQPCHAYLAIDGEACGRGVARLDQFYTHVEGLELEGERARKPFDRLLAGRIDGDHRHRRQRCAGRDIHHNAGTAGTEKGHHGLCHRHHTEGVGLEQLARRRHGRDLECTEQSNTGIVDEHIDGAARIERGGNAFRLRHVERQNLQAIRSRQDVLAWRAHGGYHVPALSMKMTRGLEAIAGRAAGDQNSLHWKSPGGLLWRSR